MRLFNSSTYINRRKQLATHVKTGVILLIGNNESPMNYEDNTFPFRQDSTFLYFFGLNKAKLAATIDCETGETSLFGDDPTIDEIVWTGPQKSLSELGENVGISSTHAFRKIYETIQYAVKSNRPIHIIVPYRHDHLILLADILDFSIEKVKASYSTKLIEGIVSQRLYKSDEELVEIESAVNITGEMHLAAMKMAHIGLKEQHVVAKLLEIATSYGGYYSFPPIVTINGETLHNHYYGNTLKKGDLLLVDSGAETNMGYAGDMTRTFPVGQKFTHTQKVIYQVVLNAHHAAVEALKPGIEFKDVHLIACKKLSEGLKNINLMKGNIEEAVEAGAHAMFFQCGLGHLMGLDVHDMENLGEQNVGYTPDMIKSTQFGLKSLRLGRKLEEGIVLTVEPGIYIIPALIDLWKADKKFNEFINYSELEKFRSFGGIRVEEDFVITKEGSRILGDEIPKSITEIEDTILL
ncbi:MAG: aminopeptidase P family protein [Cyclobacteriaceae bacterium]|nr:aminopeptidase P family protein [Cyclobacteriaceae bacterium]